MVASQLVHLSCDKGFLDSLEKTSHKMVEGTCIGGTFYFCKKMIRCLHCCADTYQMIPFLFVLFPPWNLISPESTCFWTASNFNQYTLTSLRSLRISSWYSFFCLFHDRNMASSRVSSLTVSVGQDMVMLLSTDHQRFMFAIFYPSYTLHNHTPSKKMTPIFSTVTIHFHVGIHNVSRNHVVFYQFLSHSKLSVHQILPNRWFHAPFFHFLLLFHTFTLSHS